MKDRKAKILMGLGVLLVIMGVGYAALSVNLKINGTAEISGDWNVYISNIEEKTLGNAKTVSTKVDSKTTASFSVDLEKPGSYAEYEVTVKNDGNLDAVLKAINGIDEANAAEPTDIEYRVQNLSVDTPLLIGKEIKFIVRVDFKSSATSLPTTNTKNLTLSLDFEQSTGSTVEPTVEPTSEPIVEVTDESCFMTNNGTIGGYSCDFTDIAIPDTIGGVKVTGIGEYAFDGAMLTSVVIPNGVTSIEDYAFRENQLAKVVIPNSVVSIGGDAFYGNPLNNIVIPEGVTSIGAYAFYNAQLTNVTIPSTVTSIGASAFKNNTNLTKIVNLTGRAFDWGSIINNTPSTPAITGTYGNVTVTTE